jgi:hypothetical protein
MKRSSYGAAVEDLQVRAGYGMLHRAIDALCQFRLGWTNTLAACQKASRLRV